MIRSLAGVLVALASISPIGCGAAEMLSMEELAAQIETNGANAYGPRLHAVELQGCQLTTYVWEDWNEHKKVLWSSFRVDLTALSLPEVNKDGLRSFWVADFGNGKGASILTFSVEKPFAARHEMAMRRTPKPPYEPSPRKGVDSYIYKDKNNFFTLHEGLNSADKAEAFINGLDLYRSRFCNFVS